jgi:hypothetical protein
VQQLFEFSRRLDPLMPFDAKHAAQHASLVGESAVWVDFVGLNTAKGHLDPLMPCDA